MNLSYEIFRKGLKRKKKKQFVKDFILQYLIKFKCDSITLESLILGLNRTMVNLWPTQVADKYPDSEQGHEKRRIL